MNRKSLMILLRKDFNLPINPKNLYELFCYCSIAITLNSHITQILRENTFPKSFTLQTVHHLTWSHLLSPIHCKIQVFVPPFLVTKIHLIDF